MKCITKSILVIRPLLKDKIEVRYLFSTNQTSYIDSFLATYAAKEFKYYIAYTDTSTSYYNTYPDLYIIFSKEEIIAQDGYTYALPADSVQLAIRTGNYSSNSSADNSDRVVQTVLQEQTLTVDEYEHIYTNATFEGYALQPDYYLASGGETNVQIETISFILLTVCIFLALGKLWFRRKRRF